MFKSLQKWFAIRSYAKSLGSKLRKRYGASRYYTPGQVKATVRTYGLDSTWLGYALCMYCDSDSFTQYHIDIGEPCDYKAMQCDVAAQFSSTSSNSAFDSSAAVAMAIDSNISWNGSDGSAAGGSCDSGGFDGGGGDSCS
jgi:uncharacterized membrane protein YgcG